MKKNEDESHGNSGNNVEEGESGPFSKKPFLPHVLNNCFLENILEVSSLVPSFSHALDTPIGYH